MSDYPKIPQGQYDKLKFQLRSQMAGILNVFNCYGLDPDVRIATEQCVQVAENFAKAVRGWQKPIHVIKEPRKRATE